MERFEELNATRMSVAADGSTEAHNYFCTGKNANESRHSDQKYRKSICSFGIFLFYGEIRRINATIRWTVARGVSTERNINYRLRADENANESRHLAVMSTTDRK